MYECPLCTRSFNTASACQQHINDTGHYPRVECETCYRDFPNRHAAVQHMNALDHWAPKFPCDTCDLEFFSEDAADSHMGDYGHWRHYCKACDRRFMNENNLRHHLNSRTHRGRSIDCPFCKAGYTTASGLTHHLETGSCPVASRVNRESILRTIRDRDPGGFITNRQIAWHNEQDLGYEATDQAYNGDSWECYLCLCEFSTRRGLNQHLNSPRHKEKVYKCPNKRSGCPKLFVSLAGLFGHLESEQCSFMRFEHVQKHATRILNSRKMISF
ncbi:hypothetical protein E4U21_004744 [Claviceps maximensis]|nr:hypothetical protein E4U21_004744 [Claviceps maximensis]